MSWSEPERFVDDVGVDGALQRARSACMPPNVRYVSSAYSDDL
jgi:hypothetical protein